MKFSIEDFFSKCGQIRSFLRICLHLLKKSLMKIFISCAVKYFTRVFLISITQKYCLSTSVRTETSTAWKVSKYWVFSGPYFPVFGLKMYISNLCKYETISTKKYVFLIITLWRFTISVTQSEYRKIRTRKNSVFGHFSCSTGIS